MKINTTDNFQIIQQHTIPTDEGVAYIKPVLSTSITPPLFEVGVLVSHGSQLYVAHVP